MSDEEPKIGCLFWIVLPFVFVGCWYAISFVPERTINRVSVILFTLLLPGMRLIMLLKKHRRRRVDAHDGTIEEATTSN